MVVKCFKMRTNLNYFIYFIISMISVTFALESSFGGMDEFTYNTSNVTDENVTYCFVEHAYDNLDIRTVLGKWKIMEVYMHLKHEGAIAYPICPEVTIWEAEELPRTTFGPSTENQFVYVQQLNAKFRQDYRHLRLLWDEAGQKTEYGLYFRNDSAGYWQVFGGQNGTMASRSDYQQFGGAIQVLKAVNNHLVLSFCQEALEGRPAQLYTVLFSREPGQMAHWEIVSVHNMLQNKKLSIASRRMVCGNSAGRVITSILMSMFLIAVSYVVAA